MPLFPCPDCQSFVSDSAARCPQCGSFLMKKVMAKNAKVALVVIFILLAILVGTLYQVAAVPPH